MESLINGVMHDTTPVYYYRVHEDVRVLHSNGVVLPFYIEREFKGSNLLDCKHRADRYYLDRKRSVESNGYTYPKGCTPEYIHCIDYAIGLELVEYYDEEEIYSYVIAGEEYDTIIDGLEAEESIFRQLFPNASHFYSS
jgi:hypothetical protein